MKLVTKPMGVELANGPRKPKRISKWVVDAQKKKTKGHRSP